MEPLRTDEQLAPGSTKRVQDMDTAMLGGCMVFLSTAVLAFAFAVWPHLAYPNAERATTVRMCLYIGLPPSLLIGIFAARRGGVAGACGFVGGALTTSVFFFLRLQQVFVTADSRTGPTPNYTQATLYLLPLGWFLFAVMVALVVTPRVRFSGLGAEK
ncbi:MAG TPA: hypothetical protein VKT78_17855 [Fimbriimonadaceae bacterium]|nr:hypothetical protein [Fimbriimonadaceae bacterium]